LLVLESPVLLDSDAQADSICTIQNALTCSTRDSDIKGWYREGAIGVIFTEISISQADIVQILSEKVNRALRDALTAQQMKQLALSFYIFPDDCEDDDCGAAAVSAMYPDLVRKIESRRVSLIIKRSLDVVGSLIALLGLAPLLILIALAVKLTSRGPVLFRQRRLGQYGRGFTFLKFRSMQAKSDHAIHEAYIKSFISDQAGTSKNGGANAVYKLKADTRVTRVGRFLRRSSLDELPQFFNVLAGQMSLVGPRPPIPYEFESYQIWHRRRLLEVKPGITGLWQVEGRSKVKFDDMVRMDLEYAKAWSLRLDIKILLQTPRAVLTGSGAY
jgi:exopolysaccharide biosynthesis polyprenyl glycosylphosphotransferase